MINNAMQDKSTTLTATRTPGRSTLAKAIVAGVGALFLASAAFPSQACVSTPQRMLRQHIIVKPGEKADLAILDLFSVSLPGSSTDGWRAEAAPNEATLLRMLTPEQLASAKESPKFTTLSPAGDSNLHPSERPPRLHFGAVAVGSSRLVLVNDKRQPPLSYVLDINVRPRSLPGQPQRGSVRKSDESRQGQPIGFQYYDTLEITLPGVLNDDWLIDAKGAGLSLHEKRTVDGGKVAFVFKIGSERSGNVLTIRPDSRPDGPRYAFTINHLPTPVC